MEEINRFFITEVTYKYDTERDKKVHQNKMLYDGFHAISRPFDFLRENDLIVTYQKREVDDNIARL